MLGLGLSTVARRIRGKISEWLLYNGKWNDDLKWVDEETWNDG